MTRVLVPLANGSEEIEAVIIIDTLRRAGWDVVSAGIHDGPVTGSRGVAIVPDAEWEDVDVHAFDLMVLPGGNAGTERLSGDPRVLEAVRTFHEAGKRVAAVCAGPLVLQAAGVLGGRTVTCHPGVAERITQARRVDDKVVTDDNITTSQGPGTSFLFALSLIEIVDGKEKAAAIGRAMVVSY